MTQSDSLTARQRRFVGALLTASTIKDAAAQRDYDETLVSAVNALDTLRSAVKESGAAELWKESEAGKIAKGVSAVYSVDTETGAVSWRIGKRELPGVAPVQWNAQGGGVSEPGDAE